jgi:hypothetical protein
MTRGRIRMTKSEGLTLALRVGVTGIIGVMVSLFAAKIGDAVDSDVVNVLAGLLFVASIGAVIWSMLYIVWGVL